MKEQVEPASDPKSRQGQVNTTKHVGICTRIRLNYSFYILVCPMLSLNMKVERTESRIEDVLTTLMPKEVLKESLALKFSFLGDRFFPNSFSYG